MNAGPPNGVPSDQQSTAQLTSSFTGSATLVYKSWRLIYRVEEGRQVIYAARVWHGARGEPEL